jgi:hypothetical protein
VPGSTGKRSRRGFNFGELAMTAGLDVFDTTLQHTNLWLKDLMEDLRIDRHPAYKVLSATLHCRA